MRQQLGVTRVQVQQLPSYVKSIPAGVGPHETDDSQDQERDKNDATSDEVVKEHAAVGAASEQLTSFSANTDRALVNVRVCACMCVNTRA